MELHDLVNQSLAVGIFFLSHLCLVKIGHVISYISLFCVVDSDCFFNKWLN